MTTSKRVLTEKAPPKAALEVIAIRASGPPVIKPQPTKTQRMPLIESSDPEEIKWAMEILARVGLFLSQDIIGGRDDFLPPPPTIAARVLVLLCLLNQSDEHTLSSYAKHIGWSPAALSKIATRYSDTLGIKAAWQRTDSHVILSAAARARHQGSTIKSDKARRRDRADRRAATMTETLGRADRALAIASLAR